jgi:hypothetical protein
VPASSDPRRDCDAFDVTPAELATVLAELDTAGKPADAASDALACDAEGMAGRLANLALDVAVKAAGEGMGFDFGLPAVVRPDGRLRLRLREPSEAEVAEGGSSSVVAERWAVMVALEAVMQGCGGEGGEEPARVLLALMARRAAALEGARVRAAQVAAGEGGGELARGVGAVAESAARVVAAAVKQERARMGWAAEEQDAVA